MRLWHYRLIPYLPQKQLLGQNFDCRGLLQSGWGKDFPAINYIFKYTLLSLHKYHLLILAEMRKRNFLTEKDGSYLNPPFFYSSDKLIVEHVEDNKIRIVDRPTVEHYPEQDLAYLLNDIKTLTAKIQKKPDQYTETEKNALFDYAKRLADWLEEKKKL